MSYVNESLTAGEEVLYRTGLHWAALGAPVVFGGLFGMIGLILIIGSIADKTDSGMGVFGFLFLVFAALIFVLGYLSWKATEMAVTSKRVIIKRGLLRRRTLELLHPKIESIGVEEGLIGRMFGYGTVIVRGTGGTPEPFKLVKQPLEFRKQVQQQTEKH